MYADKPGVPCFLVEWYRPELTLAALDGAIERLTRAAAGTRVRLLLTVTAPVDETIFAVIAADCIEFVIEVCRRASWHTDRITAGVQARIQRDAPVDS